MVNHKHNTESHGTAGWTQSSCRNICLCIWTRIQTMNVFSAELLSFLGSGRARLTPDHAAEYCSVSSKTGHLTLIDRIKSPVFCGTYVKAQLSISHDPNTPKCTGYAIQRYSGMWGDYRPQCLKYLTEKFSELQCCAITSTTFSFPGVKVLSSSSSLLKVFHSFSLGFGCFREFSEDCRFHC